MNLYRKRVGSEIHADGVYVSDDKGERLEIDGRQYVETPGRWIQPAGPDWYSSESDALRAAAIQISNKALILLLQAERLREEADRGTG